MSAQDDLTLNQGTEPLSGTEDFFHNLMREEKTKFHTEINWPAPMTGLDVLANYYRKHHMSGAAKVLDEYREWYRTNMVAYKRKRAQETVQIAQAQAEVAKEKKNLRELMLGTMR